LKLRDYAAVVFDLDNTITDTKRYPMRACRWLLSQAGVDPETGLEPFVRELVKEYFAGLERVVRGGPYEDPYAIVRTAMERAATSYGLHVDGYILDEATTLFRTLHVQVSELRPWAAELLHALRAAHVKLGIVTNSFEGHIRPILDRLGVLLLFDAVVDPSMMKAYKPMSKPFECVLDLLHSAPEQSLYIGDEYYADIVGARRAGMDAVWLNVREQPLDQNVAKYGPDTTPLLEIRSLEDLRPYL
jgi:HAD superfamily hydrolase (TIGR01549 family)